MQGAIYRRTLGGWQGQYRDGGWSLGGGGCRSTIQSRRASTMHLLLLLVLMMLLSCVASSSDNINIINTGNELTVAYKYYDLSAQFFDGSKYFTMVSNCFRNHANTPITMGGCFSSVHAGNIEFLLFVFSPAAGTQLDRTPHTECHTHTHTHTILSLLL